MNTKDLDFTKALCKTDEATKSQIKSMKYESAYVADQDNIETCHHFGQATGTKYKRAHELQGLLISANFVEAGTN